VHAHIHPLRTWFTPSLAIGSVTRTSLGSVSQASGRRYGHHCTESPFAASRRYLSAGRITCDLDQRYPALIALTNSCARPKSSPALCTMARCRSLCRLLRAPAGRRPFPMLSPQSVHGCLDPYPAVPPRCPFPFLPEERRPHLIWDKFGAHKYPPQCNFYGDKHFEAAVIS
jgi:hypothetical protein